MIKKKENKKSYIDIGRQRFPKIPYDFKEPIITDINKQPNFLNYNEVI